MAVLARCGTDPARTEPHVTSSVRERIKVVGRPAMLVEKGYRAATLSDRRCPVLSVVVGCDVAPMWPQGHELGRHCREEGPSCSEAERRGQPISTSRS
jgi:hypothetical protein